MELIIQLVVVAVLAYGVFRIAKWRHRDDLANFISLLAGGAVLFILLQMGIDCIAYLGSVCYRNRKLKGASRGSFFVAQLIY